MMHQLGQTAQRIKLVYVVEELLAEVPVEETLENFQGSCAGGFLRQRVPWVDYPYGKESPSNFKVGPG